MSTHSDLALQIQDDLRRSWERSRLSGVDPESLPVPYELELVEPDSRLWHTARPVLDHFGRLLDGTPTCLALADSEGRGIETWVGDPGLNPRLDALRARPGFRYAEDIAGTNGVGTPLETGRPIYIAPGEHFATPLNPLTCAGAPVRHPLTRRVEAVINLTSAAGDTTKLLLPYVMEMAKQVQDRLYEQSSDRERLLLRNFLAASRGSARPVVVVSPEIMLANPPATRLLEDVPQALLWEFAARAVGDSRATTDGLLEGEARPLAVRCFPISQDGKIVGATLEFDRSRPAQRRRPPGATKPADRLPGLAGRSPGWRRVCRQVLAVGDLDQIPGVVVSGEAGVGKRSLALALLGRGTTQEPAAFDAALEAADPKWTATLRAHLVSRTPVLLTHLECLSDTGVRTVSALIDEVGNSAPPVVATLTAGPGPADRCAPLIDRIGEIRIDVPPLRTRTEDIVDLAPAMLTRLAPGHRVGPEVLQALTRCAWPGNVRQLEATLRAAVAQARGPQIRLADLPAEIRRAQTGRRLTPMEQAELDLILGALQETGGNKVATATRLGISRTTLYRKLRSFGLELDQVVF